MNDRKFLHELSDIKLLIEQVARSLSIREQLVEKDYWIMHCLWGLKQQGLAFDLKGGTSLSKGYGIIARFSEDIDIRIEPPQHLNVKTGKNQDKPKQIESRFNFYDWLVHNTVIPGIQTERDAAFDDPKGRNGGIRLIFKSLYPQLAGVKAYILLEVGFDTTTPNEKRPISSWLYHDAAKLNLDVADNRAVDIPCYHPGCTLVEKLDAISRKYQQERVGKAMPINFIRHYYDIYKLLETNSVLDFIGTDAYRQHKTARFRRTDEMNLTDNEAFILRDQRTRALYAAEYSRTKALYYDDFPSFDSILYPPGAGFPLGTNRLLVPRLCRHNPPFLKI